MLTENPNGLTAPSFHPRIGIVVLAGGKSSRMGCDKALLATKNGLLALGQMVISAWICLRKLGHNGSGVVISGDYPGYRCVADHFENCGPLGGVHAALKLALSGGFDCDYLLFVPVDMPGLNSVFFTQLITEIRAEDLAVRFKDRELPLVLAVSPQLVKLLEAKLSTTNSDSVDLSIRSFIQEIGCEVLREVESTDVSAFVNLNTPTEYSNWINCS